MSSGGCHSLHGIRKRVDTCTEINGNISEPCELADTSVLKFGFNKVVSGEVVGDTKRIESIGTNISIKVGGVGEPRKGLRLGSSKAGRSSACTLHVIISSENTTLRFSSNKIQAEPTIISPLVAGAKAEAEPARAATTASFIMVSDN